MQINELPTTSTINASTEFAVENGGITYKAPGSTVASGLKTIMDASDDTGWVNISPLNGLTVGSVFAVRRIGKIVFVTGQNLSLSAANNTGSQTVGRLDSRFYPSTLRWDVHQARPNTDSSLYVIIRQNGDIQFNATANTAINALFFSTDYPV